MFKGIFKVNGNIVEIRLKTGKSVNGISIIYTYAPNKGYGERQLGNIGIQYGNISHSYIENTLKSGRRQQWANRPK